jgi:hypothetical protein
MTTKHTSIPSICAPGAMAIYDGQVRAGTIVKHDGSFFAFDSSGALIGEYDLLREAMIAIPNFDDVAFA